MATNNISSNKKAIKVTSGDLFKDIELNKHLAANNIYQRSDIEWYDKFNRFGVIDPYNTVGNTKEYLFFVKPDLHIYEPGTNTLNPELENKPFFAELHNRYPEVIHQLQKSAGKSGLPLYHKGPFMNVLSNSVKNTLDIPGITLGDVDNNATMWGTEIEYSGDGFSSDEKIEFSLEFQDTRYLELYHLFKAYNEYEKLKKVGLVTPPNINNAPVSNGYAYSTYYEKKQLHDQFGVYKFILDEDYTTIIYYAYLWGVRFKSVPRDTFSELNPEGGLKFSVDFKAAFIDDMNPDILINFNNLVSKYASNTKVPLYDTKRNIMNGDWAGMPYITRYYLKDHKTKSEWLAPTNMSYQYKLEWRTLK